MSDKNCYEQIDVLLRREGRRIAALRDAGEYPRPFEKAKSRYLAANGGDANAHFRAEGYAAARLGVPKAWCPYGEEDHRAFVSWMEGYGYGVEKGLVEPSGEEVIERLVGILLGRINKTDRDFENRLLKRNRDLVDEVAHLSGELAKAQKQIAILEGRYGPPKPTEKKVRQPEGLPGPAAK